MENLEIRLQRRIYASLYALLFLTILLGISVVLEGCSVEKNRSEKSLFHHYNTVGFYSVIDPAIVLTGSEVAWPDQPMSEGVAFTGGIL